MRIERLAAGPIRGQRSAGVDEGKDEDEVQLDEEWDRVESKRGRQSEDSAVLVEARRDETKGTVQQSILLSKRESTKKSHES